MQRRRFLHSLASGVAGGAVVAQSAHAGSNAAPSTAARPRWALGYRSIDQDFYQAEVPVTGSWPELLNGVFYRNGPAQHDVGSFRYDHWFDGDGLVQRFAVRNQTLTHRARAVATAKRSTEQALGRAALPAFGTVPPGGIGVTDADDLNPANISVLPHHDRLYALWEAGSAYELDPGTLATRGPKHFSEDTAGLPFSAHPRIEPDGNLWNFGYASGAGVIVLWHVDAAGQLKRCVPLKVGATGMPHDFIVTRRHIVLLLAPMERIEDAPADSSFLDLHRWNPDASTRVLVVDKDSLTLRGEYELPAQWVFHFGNGYEDESGTIHFDAARSATPEIMTHSFRSVMRGLWHEPPLPLWTEYRIDPKRRQISEQSALGNTLAVEFPRVDPRVSCRRHDSVWFLAGTERSSAPGSLNQLTRYDRRRDQLDSFAYGSDYLVEEHTVISHPDRSNAGWLIGTALNLASGTTELSLFDAYALAKGPIAHARLPYAMPLGFHGAWAAAS
ncbi:MAG: carotenoid oxygenase family protein [Pseudomonadota bacterium]